MFTGIVRTLGVVKSNRKRGDGRVLVIDMGKLGNPGNLDALDMGSGRAIQIGDSIAVNGACLTITDLSNHPNCLATFAVSPETMARCLMDEWGAGDSLNLETALTLQTPLGGHLVSGHIDGIGTLIARHPADAFTRMELEAPLAIGRLIAHKGAIAVDGVSLTTNTVSDHAGYTRFEVMIVPHTADNTTLGALQPGARVHLEADTVARYVQRLSEVNDKETAENK